MFTFYKQFEAIDCGPTCLKMIVRHYGKNIGIQTLRDLCCIDREGVSIAAIVHTARKIGFQSLAVKITNEANGKNNFVQIKDLALPAIIHWNNTHFVVVYKITPKYVYIADPAVGKIKLTHEAFARQAWKDNEFGKAVLFEPTTDFYTADKYFLKEIRNDYRYFKQIIFENKRSFIKIILLLLVTLSIQSISPFITQKTFDNGIFRNDIGLIKSLLIIQVFLFLFSSGISYLQGVVTNGFSQKLNAKLISDFVKKIFRIPIQYYNQRKTSDFIQRINDYSRIDSFLTYNLSSLLISVLSILVYSAILSYYSVSILGAVLGFVCLYALWIRFFSSKRREINYNRFDIQLNTHSLLLEMIEGVNEIKLAASEEYKVNKWLRNQKNFYANNLRTLRVNQLQALGSGLLNQVSYALITFYTAYLVIQNIITIGEMAAIQLIVAQINGPFSNLISTILIVQDVKYSWERILEWQSLEDERSGNLELKQAPAIIFENVSFSFNELSGDVVSNVSFTIRPGETTAVVGASGSGKTTLLKLALGLYVPTKGKILLGQHSMEHYDVSQWRQKCGVVMQNGFIFTDTIKNNIVGREDDYDLDRYIQALKMASIYDFVISLPIAHNTLIGKGGVGLSTGQQQRIMLARMFYKNPDYIFLDEATNSLDSQTEANVVQFLNNEFANKTKLIIAHRLNTIINADKIIVLEQGKIAEEGTHHELFHNKGVYYNLFQKQVSGEENIEREILAK